MPSVIYMPPYIVPDALKDLGLLDLGTKVEDSSEDYIPYPHHFMFYVIFCVNCTTTVLGLIGNTLLILTYSRNISVRTTTNTYILSIAVTDLLVSLTCAVMPIVQDLVGSWPLNQVSCKLSQALMEFSTFATVLTLTAICIERYYAVMYPIESYVSTKSFAVLITSVVWIISLLFCVPKFIHAGLRRHRIEGVRGYTTVSYCVIQQDATDLARYLSLVDFLVFYTVPLCIVCAVYVTVCRHLTQVTDDAARRTSMTVAQIHQARLRYRVAKMVIVLSAIFFVGFLPHNILILRLFFLGMTDSYWNSAASYSYCYGCLHFWMNPIAMYFCSDTVRRHFNRYLCCRRREHKPQLTTVNVATVHNTVL